MIGVSNDEHSRIGIPNSPCLLSQLSEDINIALSHFFPSPTVAVEITAANLDINFSNVWIDGDCFVVVGLGVLGKLFSKGVPQGARWVLAALYRSIAVFLLPAALKDILPLSDTVFRVLRSEVEVLPHITLDICLIPLHLDGGWFPNASKVWRNSSFHCCRLASDRCSVVSLSPFAAWAWLRQRSGDDISFSLSSITAVRKVCLLSPTANFPRLPPRIQQYAICERLNADLLAYECFLLVGATLPLVTNLLSLLLQHFSASRVVTFFLVDDDPTRLEQVFEFLRLRAARRAMMQLNIVDVRLVDSVERVFDLSTSCGRRQYDELSGSTGSGSIGLPIVISTGETDRHPILMSEEGQIVKKLYLHGNLSDGSKRSSKSTGLPWSLVRPLSVPRLQDRALLAKLERSCSLGKITFHSARNLFPGNGATTTLQRVALALAENPTNIVVWVPDGCVALLEGCKKALSEALERVPKATSVFILATQLFDSATLSSLREYIALLLKSRLIGVTFLQTVPHVWTDSYPPDDFVFTPTLAAPDARAFAELYASSFPEPSGGLGELLEQARDTLADNRLFVCMFPLCASLDVDSTCATRGVAALLDRCSPNLRLFLRTLALLELLAGRRVWKGLPGAFKEHECDFLLRSSRESRPQHVQETFNFRLSSVVFAFPILRFFSINLRIAANHDTCSLILRPEDVHGFVGATNAAFDFLIESKCNLKPWLALIRTATRSSLPVWLVLLRQVDEPQAFQAISYIRHRLPLSQSNRKSHAYWCHTQLGVLEHKLYCLAKDWGKAKTALDAMLKEDPRNVVALHHRSSFFLSCLLAHDDRFPFLDRDDLCVQLLKDLTVCVDSTVDDAPLSYLRTTLINYCDRLTNRAIHDGDKFFSNLATNISSFCSGGQFIVRAAASDSPDVEVEPSDDPSGDVDLQLSPLARWENQPTPEEVQRLIDDL
jgi:hypothetical protein